MNVCILVSEADPTLKPSLKRSSEEGSELLCGGHEVLTDAEKCLLFLCCFRSSSITLWDASSSSSPPSSPRRRAVEFQRWWPDRYVSAQLRDSRCVTLQQTSSVCGSCRPSPPSDHAGRHIKFFPENRNLVLPELL